MVRWQAVCSAENWAVKSDVLTVGNWVRCKVRVTVEMSALWWVGGRGLLTVSLRAAMKADETAEKMVD